MAEGGVSHSSQAAGEVESSVAAIPQGHSSQVPNATGAEATGLTSKQLDRIKRNKEQAKARKTARLLEQSKLVWAPALAGNSDP